MWGLFWECERNRDFICLASSVLHLSCHRVSVNENMSKYMDWPHSHRTFTAAVRGGLFGRSCSMIFVCASEGQWKHIDMNPCTASCLWTRVHPLTRTRVHTITHHMNPCASSYLRTRVHPLKCKMLCCSNFEFCCTGSCVLDTGSCILHTGSCTSHVFFFFYLNNNSRGAMPMCLACKKCSIIFLLVNAWLLPCTFRWHNLRI